jgi:hypothetical protein
MTLYQDLMTAGIPVDSHESDLYFPSTPESRALLHQYPILVATATTFRHTQEGTIWYDIPFAYDPWWEART